ncbi:MarR family winged helix-turn-helix transcriptional regulator [Microbulbifer sp. 2304DJ12-6]|uniref:MarR family winged helix-turn-helix transcriptional regulator n=1 Tax=Microbulbifer sp. 2304DJ12-6 TaxID=3233340 RepID=UPI0039AF2CD8
MPSSSKPFFYASKYRAAFLASMAERLRDLICEDGSKLLKAKGVTAPVTDVSFMLFLSENEPSFTADIARALNFSHQRVASRILVLEKLKLVTCVSDRQDQRRKRVTLTKKGRAEVLAQEEIYKNVALAFEDLFEEIGDDLMDRLQLTLETLKQESLSERVDRLK